MFALLHSLGMFGIDLFKPRRRLEVENLFLRHQLSIALRRAPPRLRLGGSDGTLRVLLTRLWPACSRRAGSFNRRPSFGGTARVQVFLALEVPKEDGRPKNPKWEAYRI